MKKETITRIKLTASEGHILTDGENYGKIIYLASGDEGEKWYEITEEEYQKKMEEAAASIPNETI
jgi:hypothetical protein